MTKKAILQKIAISFGTMVKARDKASSVLNNPWKKLFMSKDRLQRLGRQKDVFQKGVNKEYNEQVKDLGKSLVKSFFEHLGKRK